MSDTIIKMTGGVIRQQKNTILKDVNVEIKSGEFIYLIGKVGSGKSSFLKTLYAELPLEYGSGEVAGYELKRIKKSQIPLLRRKCGIVFQDFKLLIDRNVYANLEFVLRATGWTNKKAIRERIDTVLEKVGMAEKRDKMPHQLSGGEQQRIVLARALLNAPPIILADEPTGNIDPETSYRLIELLREICDTGKTIIIATHQYDLIEKYPGRVLCCSEGKLYEKCDPATSQAIKEEDSATGNAEELPEPGESDKLPSPEEPACLTGTATQITEEITIPAGEPEKIGNIGETPETPAEIPGNGDFETMTESLLGKLTFPEVSAFDYEITEPAPASATYAIPEEQPVIPTAVEATTPEILPQVESNIPDTAQADTECVKSDGTGETPTPEKQEDIIDTTVPEQKKPEDKTSNTPTFDLELID